MSLFIMIYGKQNFRPIHSYIVELLKFKVVNIFCEQINILSTLYMWYLYGTCIIYGTT